MPSAESRPRLAYSASRHRDELARADDRELLAALGEDDEAALDELVERKTKPLVQLAQRILGDAEEARDVVQVTFLRVWENRDKFDERWSPNTWIYRIASNLAIDQLRSKKSRDRTAEPYRLHAKRIFSARSRAEASSLGEREVAGIFRELAAGLSEKQRLVFVLRELEGLSSAEVAEIAGCRESTVRNHLFNARRTLRRAVAERYPEYLPARDPGAAGPFGKEATK